MGSSTLAAVVPKSCSHSRMFNLVKSGETIIRSISLSSWYVPWVWEPYKEHPCDSNAQTSQFLTVTSECWINVGCAFNQVTASAPKIGIRCRLWILRLSLFSHSSSKILWYLSCLPKVFPQGMEVTFLFLSKLWIIKYFFDRWLNLIKINASACSKTASHIGQT